jgi:hypothetical protein
MVLQVRIANNYGNEAIYPVSQNAITFAEIAGTKTLSRSTIALVKSLGYSVEVVTAKAVTL